MGRCPGPRARGAPDGPGPGIEFRHPIANALTGVLFADVGDAWGGKYETVNFNGFKQHSGFSPSMGLGVGIRVVTPKEFLQEIGELP